MATLFTGTGCISFMLDVEDLTALVHPNMAGTALTSTHIWTFVIMVLTFLPMMIN